VSYFFWQGVLHPLIVPAHVMVLLALGLLLGQQAKPVLRTGILTFAISLMIALALTRVLPRLPYSEFILLALALALGLVVILKLNLTPAIPMIFSIITGILVGLDSAVTGLPGLGASKIYIQLAGTGLSASLILTSLALLSFALNKLLAGVPVRVIGAWVTAGSLMVLTLLLHGLLKAN
jgi:urease accessory protein